MGKSWRESKLKKKPKKKKKNPKKNPTPQKKPHPNCFCSGNKYRWICVLNIALPGSPSAGPGLGFGIFLIFKSNAVSWLLEVSA